MKKTVKYTVEHTSAADKQRELEDASKLGFACTLDHQALIFGNGRTYILLVDGWHKVCSKVIATTASCLPDLKTGLRKRRRL